MEGMHLRIVGRMTTVGKTRSLGVLGVVVGVVGVLTILVGVVMGVGVVLRSPRGCVI